MIQPPVWNRDELESASRQAEEHFRSERHTEPLETYLALFDEYRDVVAEVMERTADLTRLNEPALSILSDPTQREVFRYLTGPPVSEDDLKVLMGASSISPARLAADSELLKRIVQFVVDWHDRRRFHWVREGGEPKENDRAAAVLATTALLAMRRLETMRRNDGKTLQERTVALRLLDSGFTEVATRRISSVLRAPAAGEFCRESLFGSRKADFVIGLFDGHTVALECKVSNSSTNSVKRLNNDAAIKAETWKSDFGAVQVVAAAVLSGVYNVNNLEDAQRRGLTLFWAHDLDSMMGWLCSTQMG